MSADGLMAALEKHGAAVSDTAPALFEPAQSPSTPSTETPQPTPQNPPTPGEQPPATPTETPAATPPTVKTPDEIEREIRERVESEYRRKEDGWKGQTKKWENEAKRTREALDNREKAIDTDLARLRDAAPTQEGRQYYQAAIDQRGIARERQELDEQKQQITEFAQTFQQQQARAEENLLRTEAPSILPGYLKEALAKRGLPEEAGAELLRTIDTPANKNFLQAAPLDGAFAWLREMGTYIDTQIPTLQTQWAQGNRGAARQSGEHWRPTGGASGGAPNAAPKTMADTSTDSLVAFLSNYQG